MADVYHFLLFEHMDCFWSGLILVHVYLFSYHPQDTGAPTHLLLKALFISILFHLEFNLLKRTPSHLFFSTLLLSCLKTTTESRDTTTQP